MPRHITAYVQELESNDPQALLAIFDRDGYYLYATPNHEQAIGYTTQELTSMHLSQTVDPPLHHAAWVLRTVSVLYTKPIQFSSRLVTKSGEIVHISGNLRHLHEPGSDRYFVTSVRLTRP